MLRVMGSECGEEQQRNENQEYDEMTEEREDKMEMVRMNLICLSMSS